MTSSIVAVLCLVALSGCAAPAQPTPAPTAEPTTAASTGPTPDGPVLRADGTAEENLAIFSQVVDEIWATEQRASGRAYIDALTAVGFDRAAMQLTPDTSTVGNPAESIQFSVRWGDDECLIGQVGPSTGEPATAVMPQLAEGRCLIGNTRPIDW